MAQSVPGMVPAVPGGCHWCGVHAGRWGLAGRVAVEDEISENVCA